MIKELMYDSIFLAIKSGVTTKEDLQVAQDFLDTLDAFLQLFPMVFCKKFEHNNIRCITPSEILSYNFCPADEKILKRIYEVCK